MIVSRMRTGAWLIRPGRGLWRWGVAADASAAAPTSAPRAAAAQPILTMMDRIHQVIDRAAGST
jgi:hypothetical protein